ncbi:MAG: 50S ribosomal protein L21 [Candidatus Neomarinimicrobiota bacterium]
MRTNYYAIAEISGDQVILEPGKKLSVPKLELEVGATFVANKILYLRKGEDIQIGMPFVKDAEIETTVLEQKRLPKVIVFKKKRRKGYKVKNGHRQPYTVLQVSKFAGQPEAAPTADPNPVAETTNEKPTEN